MKAVASASFCHDWKQRLRELGDMFPSYLHREMGDMSPQMFEEVGNF